MKLDITCSGIYTITNIVNNKLYVGYANNIRLRWDNHKRKLKNNKHENIYLQAAYNKYGKENFKFEVLEKYDSEFLPSMEHWWCIMLNTHNRKYGYNIKATNPSFSNTKMSLESKIKIINTITNQFKEGRVGNRKGTKVSSNAKEKMRLAKLGKSLSKEHILKITSMRRDSHGRYIKKLK